MSATVTRGAHHATRGTKGGQRELRGLARKAHRRERRTVRVTLRRCDPDADLQPIRPVAGDMS